MTLRGVHIVIILIYTGACQTVTPCTENQEIGMSNLTSSPELDAETGVAILMKQDKYMFQCCGFIHQWKFRTTPNYTSGSFDTQVWKLESGNTYTLLGSNTLTPVDPGTMEAHLIDIGQRIRTCNSSYIGIHTTGDFIVTHEDSTGDRLKLTGVTSQMTSPYDWSLSDVQTEDYAISADVIPSQAPTLASMTDVTVFNDVSVGSIILSVAATDEDIEDIGSLTLTIQAANNSGQNYFEIATGSFNITVKEVPPLGSYTLTLKVEDPCNMSSTAIQTIIIQNRPPTINNIPSNISISEDTADDTLIYTIDATDTVTDHVTCTGSTYKFKVQNIPFTISYGVFTKSGTHFNYDYNPDYTITVTCDDGDDAVSADLNVNLIRNEPPTIHNLPNVTSISEDMSTRTLLYTINVTDNTGDPVTCTLNPASSLFEISLDPPATDYGIYLTGGTALNYDSTPSYELTIYCADARRSSAEIFTVNLIQNMAPTINNLPNVTSITEDLSTRTLLYAINVTDSTGDPITCSLNTTSSVFDLSFIPSTTEYGIYLTGGTTLNYDTTPSYELTVQCSDTRRSSTGLLTVNLIQNMPPTIHNLPHVTSINEDLNTRTLLYTINVTDSTGDPIKCTLNPPSSLFDVSLIPAISEYGIYLTGGTTLTYDTTPSYNLTVDCADNRRSETGIFTVNLIKNTPPTIHNLPNATSIYEDVSTRTLLYTINVTDSTGDPITCTLNSTSSVFDVSIIPSATEYGIYLTGGTTLDYDIIPSYDLVIDCADASSMDTGTFTVNLIPNMAPTINSLPNVTSISEDVSTRTLLYAINVTDITGDLIACSLNTTSSVFDLSLIPSSTEYGIYLSGGTTLNYDTTPSYELTVQCFDSRRSSTGILTVNLIQNMSPTIHNLPHVTNINEDLITRTLLYTINVTDSTGDPITCTLNPPSSLFDVSLIPANSEYGIYLTGGTTLNYDTTPSYNLTIDCADNRRSDTEILTVNIIPNTPPTIHNLPYATSIYEDVSTRTLLYTINVTDSTGDPITCTLNSTSSVFDVSLVPSATEYGIYLTGGTTLNYDTTPLYKLIINCADASSLETGTFTVNLIPNMPPTIHNLPNVTSIYEDLNTRTLLYSINVTDSTGDPITCTLNSSSSIFDVSPIPSTTEYGIYLSGGTTLNYDVTSSYQLTVNCADLRRSNTGIFKVNLIRNVPPTINNLPNVTSIYEDLSTRTLLYTINATDSTGDHIKCTLNPPSPIFDVSLIPTTTDYGIYLTGGTTLNYDTTPSYVFIVKCADARRSDTGIFTINLIKNLPPTIHNLPNITSIYEDLNTRTLLYTINVTDSTGDPITCTLLSYKSVFDVSLIPSSTVYGIYLTGGTTLNYDVRHSYMLKVDCADARRSDIEIFTVNLIQNMPPTILNLPMSCDLSEDTVSETLLYTVSVTDPTNDTVTCSMTTITTTFYLQSSINSFEYDLYVISNPGFSYNIKQSYALMIKCADARRSVSSVFYVNLLPNKPPKFVNLQGKTTLPALTSYPGMVVFTVLAKDPENDHIQFFLTAPSNAPFSINQNNGVISLSRSIKTEFITGYDLRINISDHRTTVGPNTLTVLITGIAGTNCPPRIHNLPRTVTVLEGVPIGSLVFQPRVDDKDLLDNHSFTVNFNPPEGSVYFNVNKTGGQVTTNANIDYESISSKIFVLTLTVTDSLMKNNETLTLKILNVNESPKFTKTSYELTASEGSAGMILPNPYYQYTEEDGDAVHFSFDCGRNTGRLDINNATGVLTYAVDYDVDVYGTDVHMHCQVFISDMEYTDRAFLNITVLDINDHYPTFRHNLYTFFVNLTTNVGTIIGRVDAKDADIGRNGIIIHYIEQGSIYSGVFDVDKNGTIFLRRYLTNSGYTEGSKLMFKVYAVDPLGRQAETNILVVIFDMSVHPVPVDSPILYKSFFTHAPNMAWFVPLMFALFITVCVVIHTIWILIMT